MWIKKVKSSSIVEVVVSLVIFSVIFGLAITLIYRLNGKKNPIALEARLLLNSELIKAKSENLVISEQYELENFSIEKEITDFDKNLIMIKLIAKRDGKFIDEIYEILPSN
jgi:hypothetical protein